MIKATFTMSTESLKIFRSLNELIQAAIYTNLPDSEHKGYGKENKNFKTMNFWASQDKEKIELKFSALNKEHEATIAKAILLDSFKIGALHFASKQVEIQDTRIETNEAFLCGFVCVYVKDAFGKRLFLEPRDDRFTESLKKNCLQKYEVLLGEAHMGGLEIEVLYQHRNPKRFFYGKAVNVSWWAKYRVRAESKMLNLLLDTGMGSKAMQGMGFVEEWENEKKI